MIKWVPLENFRQLDEIIEISKQTPCLIFKHSTRCAVSSMAKYRLESDWNFAENELKAYFLDLFAHRTLSEEIANRFQVYHESPQVLLIRDGMCTYDASHLDISVEELRECFEDVF